MALSARIAFVFPGQGSQTPGMLATLRQDNDACLGEAQRVLGRDLSELDSAQALAGTQATQLALLIAGVAGARRLERRGIVPTFVAGHSVGAFAAAVHAQVLSYQAALGLVELRGSAMARAYPCGYGMAAISGIAQGVLDAWIDEARARGAVLHVANRNADTQFTVSGADSDLAALIERARNNGAGKALKLAVAAPSHSPLMDAVAQTMRAAIGQVALSAPRFAYVANSTARALGDATSVGDDLAGGVAQPVRWHDIVVTLYERGVRTFIEMPPGSVLSNLTRCAFDDVRAFALETTDLDALQTILVRST